MANKMIFSLDIGCSKIVALVGSIDERVEVHGVSTYYFTNNINGNDFSNITNGIIINLEQIGAFVNQTLNEARIEADCSIGSVVINISGLKVCNLYSTDEILLVNQNISAQHIKDLIDNAIKVKLPDNYELLDYEVQEYLVDEENYTLNPLHLMANKLKSNINLFLGARNQIANITKVIRYSGFNLSKIVPSGILSGMSVLNREEKELGCCLLDIGSGTTDIIVFENGFIRYLYSLPIGGENITNDIASVLKISRNLAEDIKLNYGSCSYIGNTIKLVEGISLSDHRGINISISRKLLVDIITERVKEIFELVKQNLVKQNIHDIINSGIVITGGTALLPNIEDLSKQYFGLPVRIGAVEYEGDFSDIVINPKYATSFGGLNFVKDYMASEFGGRKLEVAKNGNISIFAKIKQFFS
jgi:cell division protein FtsA